MVRIREPLTGWGPLRVPSAGLRGDPAGLSRQPKPQPGQVRPEATGPGVVLSFSFPGWCRRQDGLERVPELVCTVGTGALGRCDMAARAWANAEESGGDFTGMTPASPVQELAEDELGERVQVPMATWYRPRDDWPCRRREWAKPGRTGAALSWAGLVT